ncbi:MAG: response regulator [Sulfuritalea sp.]|nr:response regulator [Sulfuritalea sp.]
MTATFRIFVVDDDPFVRDVIRGILEPDCVVETFDSVETCAPRLETLKPDMFLLDVRMPGMDGYTFCRQLKDDENFAHIPVTFVSSQDTIDARMKGYDAGGEDFILKPFEVEEVQRKVAIARQIVESRIALETQAKEAQKFSFMVMASMDEAGIVLNFMSQLVAWETERDIAAGLLELLQRYQIEGVVQTRIAGRSMTFSASGENLPLEVSVMNHVSGMDRIFDFRNRSVHNFERVTLMVSNLPLDNPDYCGRLRDNLSIAAKGTESKLQSLEALELNRRGQEGILATLEYVRGSADSLRQAGKKKHAAARALMLALDERLANEFIHLGLTEYQERQVSDMVTGVMKQQQDLLDNSEETDRVLHDLSERLGQLTAGLGNKK